jgi:hypothetical protein
MREFLEELAIIIISIIQATAIMMLVILCATLSLGKKKDIIGTNMNNETKEYVRVINNSLGVTADGTRDFLKSYKFNK